MTKKQLLKKSPTVVKKLPDGAEYIPIGQIEQTLDELFEDWSTGDFKFQVLKAGNFWFADASCILYVGNRHMQGAVTFQISSKDNNMDFSATALSFCISNAAKRLGIRFGRALNGRIDAGETSIPVIQTKEAIDINVNEELEWLSFKQIIDGIEFKEDAQIFLDTTTYRLTVAAKNIVNSKPTKAK